MNSLLLFAVEFGAVDPLALVVASFATVISLLAFWLTWQETRRNNTAIVKVTGCQGTEKRSIQDGWQPSQEFTIVLHNRGISLWDVKVSLEFLGEQGFGSCSYELSPKSKDEDLCANQFIGHKATPTPTPPHEEPPAEFARGMIAEFEITSRKLPPVPNSKEMFVQIFSGLTDARKQQAKFTVHSQGYQVCSISIGGFRDRLKGKWNWRANKINSRFDKVIENPYAKRGTSSNNPGQAMLDNAPMRIQGRILPTFLTLEDKLMVFVWLVKQQKQQPTGQQPTDPQGQG